MKSSLKRLCAGMLALAFVSPALAKLPPPPPPDPAKAEEAKQKAADAAKKDAELMAKYTDLAVANYAAKAKAEGKEFKPQMGPGVPGAPAVAAATPAKAAAKAPAKK